MDFSQKPNGIRKSYLKIFTNIKVKEPLKSGFFLKRDTGSDVWITLRYASMANLCFKCGQMGHREAICRDKKNYPFGPRDPREAFGIWIHMDSTFSGQKFGVNNGNKNWRPARAPPQLDTRRNMHTIQTLHLVIVMEQLFHIPRTTMGTFPKGPLCL